MSDKSALYFFIGAHYGRPIMLMVAVAIALFAIFGTIFFR